MRKCPKCQFPMGQSWLYRQEIERCAGCNGIFLDEGELGDIVRLMRLYRSVELEEPEAETLDESEREAYNCPSCESTLMNREDYGGLPVDTCSDCRGVWLDDGELVSFKRTEMHIKANLNLYVRLGQ